jgi:uracil-DNA glycosylase
MTTWADILGQEKQQPYFKQMMQFVKSQRVAGKAIYPPSQDVFNAFDLTELIKLTVYLFQCSQALKRPLHWLTYIKN